VPSKLFGIDVGEWVLGTSAKMRGANSAERSDWNRYWYETYRELGGGSEESGKKGCPCAGAYGLWFLGRTPRSGRPHLGWSVSQVRERLGKNAAYAVIAAKAHRANSQLSPRERWAVVRATFEREAGGRAAGCDQGEVRVAVALSEEGLLS
jgi:hypothetical protein